MRCSPTTCPGRGRVHKAGPVSPCRRVAESPCQRVVYAEPEPLSGSAAGGGMGRGGEAEERAGGPGEEGGGLTPIMNCVGSGVQAVQQALGPIIS